MTSPTPAERVALRVAEAAAQSPASAYGLPSTIVFALGSAGLLMDPETAVELDEYRRQFPAMNEALAQAAAQVADMVQRLASTSASMDAATKAIQADGESLALLRRDLRDVRAARADAHDDLAAALGRDASTEWSDLIDTATTCMRVAEGIESAGAKALRAAEARVAGLEALVCACGAAAEQRHQYLDPSEPPVTAFIAPVVDVAAPQAVTA